VTSPRPMTVKPTSEPSCPLVSTSTSADLAHHVRPLSRLLLFLLRHLTLAGISTIPSRPSSFDRRLRLHSSDAALECSDLLPHNEFPAHSHRMLRLNPTSLCLRRRRRLDRNSHSERRISTGTIEHTATEGAACLLRRAPEERR